MSKNSENFNLILPEGKDYYDVEQFNSNFNTIDGLLNRVLEEENGYVYLGKNLLIQWGNLYMKTYAREYDVYFPIEFSKIFNLQITNEYSGSKDGEVYDGDNTSRLVEDPRNDGFKLFNLRLNGPITFWLAIGIVK